MPIRKESIQIISAVRSNLESCIMGKSFEIFNFYLQLCLQAGTF